MEFSLILIMPFWALMCWTAYRKGELSADFLLLIFLMVGVPLRALQLFFFPESSALLAPWVLEDKLEKELLGAVVAITAATAFALVVKEIILIPFGSRHGAESSKQGVGLATLSTGVPIVRAAAISVTALVLFFYLFAEERTLYEVWLGLLSRDVNVTAGRGYVTWLLDVPIVAALLAAAYVWRRDYRSGRRYTLGLTALVMVGAAAAVMTGGRGILLQFFLALALIRTGTTQRLSGTIPLFIALTALAIVVVIGGLVLRTSVQSGEKVSVIWEEMESRIIQPVSAPFALIDHYLLAEEFSSRRGHDYGTQYVEYVVRPIPRTVWEGKPQLLGLRIRGEFWGDDLGGIPPSYFGEAFIAFGLFGVVGAGMVLGVALGALSLLRRMHKRRPSVDVIYATLAVLLAFTLIRSGLEIALFRAIQFVALIMLLDLLFRIRLVPRRDPYDGAPTNLFSNNL